MISINKLDHMFVIESAARDTDEPMDVFCENAKQSSSVLMQPSM